MLFSCLPLPEASVDTRFSTLTSVKIGGGADEIRTHDLCIANAALYQLSYNPKNLSFEHMVGIRRLELPRYRYH